MMMQLVKARCTLFYRRATKEREFYSLSFAIDSGAEA